MSFLNTDTELWIFFLSAVGVALLGGWHCAGMCGAFSSFTTRSQDAFFYQMGRLSAYVSLGVLSSFFGARVLSVVPESFRLYAGLGLALFALWILLSGKSAKLPQSVFSLFRKLKALRFQPLSFFGMGVLNGFLPCHWLYGFLAVAAGLGSPTRGAILLFALWVGSSPWLLGVASLSAFLKRHSKMAPWVPKVFLVFVVMSFLLFPYAGHLFAGHGTSHASPIICGSGKSDSEPSH